MPRQKQDEIHCNFSTDPAVWTAFRAEVTGFYGSYDSSELNDHIVREFNKKIRDLGQSSSLYISPYDDGLRYTGNGTVFNG